ncbi:MAG: F0F1 ATP synthase subunit A [Nitrospinota bacterium]
MEHPLLYIQIPGLQQWPHVTYSWLVMAVLVLASFLITRGLQTIPYGGQNAMEALFELIQGFMDDVMGHEGRRYFPLIFTLAIYIFLSNLLGLVPGAMSPTSNINTNVGCALTVFLTTHYIGAREHGWRYVRHFTGPILWLAPIMVPIEIITHLARPLSLSLRLFGNIRGEDLVLIILAGLVPLVIPSFMIVFAVFTSFVQAFVFVLLSMIYLAGSLEHAH